MFDSLFTLLNFLWNIFQKLPQYKKDEIINIITGAFQNIFKKKNNSTEDIKKAAKSVMDEHWTETSTFAVKSSLPLNFTNNQKEKFAASIIELVRSDKFLVELEGRLQKYNNLSGDEYIEKSSFEMKKLITEMIK